MEAEKINKFENATRIAELNPAQTLIKAGFHEGMTLCDIGAGTGVFSFPAAEISKNDIFALEVSEEMLKVLTQRIVERDIKNIKIKRVVSATLPVEANCFDMVIMVTVLHELDNKEFMLKEINRILKDSGKLMVIEFHHRKTPMGPSVEHRIAKEKIEEICAENGLRSQSEFLLGENFYGVIFGKMTAVAE